MAEPGTRERVCNVEITDGEHVTPCRRCGKPVRLRYNGGELDYDDCCGLSYCLTHERIDLLVWEIGADARKAARPHVPTLGVAEPARSLADGLLGSDADVVVEGKP